MKGKLLLPKARLDVRQIKLFNSAFQSKVHNVSFPNFFFLDKPHLGVTKVKRQIARSIY